MTAWVALGAAVGGLLRFAAEYVLPPVGTRAYPRATLLVNLTGSFAIGVAQAASADVRTVITVGVCGALTTFSGVSLQVYRRLSAGSTSEGAAYLAVSLAGCVALAWLGLQLASRLVG